MLKHNPMNYNYVDVLHTVFLAHAHLPEGQLLREEE